MFVPVTVPDVGSFDVFLDSFITLDLLQPPTAGCLVYAVPVMIETFA